MDKRKGIILAVVLFLLIGLGTFVFADEPNDDPGKNTGETNGPSDTNNDGSTTNPDEESEVQDEENSGTDEEGVTATNRRPSNSGSTQVIIGGNTGENTSSSNTGNGSNEGEEEQNPGEVEEEPDTTAPVITINGESYQGKGNDIGYVNGDVILSLAEENLTVVVIKDGEELSFEDGMTLSLDGKYVITVTDEAGNITEVEVSIDTTAPKFNVTSGTHSDTAIEIDVTDMSLDYVLVYNQDKDEETKENKSEFILEEEATYKLTAVDKLGNETTVWVAIDKTKPDIKVSGTNAIENKFGGEVTLKVFDKFLTEVSVNGEVFTEKDFISAGNNENRTFTINYENNSKNSGTYIVNAKDKFGHDNTYEFTIDNDAPESNWVYILNADEDNRTIIGNNQKLIVEINVNEELGKNPVITIGDWTEELTRRANDSRYIYSKTITIDAEKMKLVHDEDIKFTIEVTDLVGNTTTLDNDDVTYHEEKGYGQVKYDGEAPVYASLGMQNNDHTSGHEDGDITVANIGDHIRILMRFDELLATTPKITIGDSEEIELKLHTDYKNFKEYTYWADIELTEDMNLSDGALEYVIYGYADAAGNVGKTLSSEDNPINNSSLPGVTIDTKVENPAWVYTLNLSDENNRKTIRDGQTLRVEANFTEELVKKPKLTIGDSQSVDFRKCGETSYGKYVCVADITIDNSIANLENNKVIPIQITNIEDKGGNTLVLDNSDITETSKYGEVTYDGEAPKIINLGITGFLEEAVDGADAHYVNDGKGIRILIYVNELLEVDPTVEIGNQTFTATYRQKSSDLKNNIYAYYVDIEDVSKLGLEQGIIEFTVSGYKDKIGNVGETVTQKDTTYSENSFNQVTYDSIDPELEVEQLQSNGYVNTENTQINVDDANPFTTQVFDENGEVLNTREAQQAADGTYYDRFGIGWLGEGKFTVKVTDKAGNITEETFTVDHTPASMVYSTVDFDGTGIDYVEENKQKIFYIKNDTSFVFRMQFSEELAENPILTINGTKKTELELVEKFVTNEGKYIYQGTVNVTAEDKFEDGQLQLIVSNIKDLAGNETTDPLVTDQTVTSNSRTVVLDSKIDVVLFKINSNNANSSSLAKAGDWIGIYLQVGEELKQDPTFMINGEVVTTSYLGEFNGVYAYQAGITVTKEMSGKIDFAISNIIDKANNNLTLSSEECEYSVTIDNDAPIIDLSAIPSKFEVGVDTYVYPQPGVVTDNVDGNISFGNVHMNWYHMNDDRTKGEATTCFGYNNWNTTLKGCSLGNYIITYRVSDTVGNETTAEKQITLQDTTKAVIEPDRKDGETFIQGVDKYNTETGTITDNYDDVNFSAVNIEYYLKNNDGSETHVAYFDKPSDLSNIQAGVYRIHYWYRDSSDNYSEVSRILYVKNMDAIEKVNELVQDAVRAMNDGNMAVKDQQHAIDLARQEANKLPNFVEKDAALETINNLQAAMDNNNKYREVYGYLLSAQEAYADNDLTNTQHYIDVVKQQISNIDGFETEVANIEKAINELQENVNNKKGFDNALALLETAQTSFNDGSLDETVQYNIDVARQSLSKFEGYATEKQNIINALDMLQTNFNNRKNYNRCLELLEIAKTSLTDGSSDEIVQYNIDVAYQSLEKVTGYETELANIKASLDKISSELHNR